MSWFELKVSIKNSIHLMIVVNILKWKKSDQNKTKLKKKGYKQKYFFKTIKYLFNIYFASFEKIRLGKLCKVLK